MRPRSSCSPRNASRRSSTRWQTLDGCPSQIGVPSTKMSASRMRLRSAGQSSPSPSSLLTPGLISRSTARTSSPSTSCSRNSPSNSLSNSSQLELSGDAFRVQFRARARSGMIRHLQEFALVGEVSIDLPRRPASQPRPHPSPVQRERRGPRWRRTVDAHWTNNQLGSRPAPERLRPDVIAYGTRGEARQRRALLDRHASRLHRRGSALEAR
jgi:hypothetical protein